MADILTTAQALAQMPEGVDSTSTRFTLAVSGASEWMNRACNRVWHTANFAAWHSGYAASNIEFGGKTYWGRYALYLLDPATRLPTLPVTTVSSITENGTTLTSVRLSAATSFTDGTAFAIIDDIRGIAWKASVTDGVPSPIEWASGIANIRVSYTAGYKRSDEVAAGVTDLPLDIVEAAAHVAAMMVREGWRTGISSQGELGGTVSYDRLLLPILRDAIARHRIPSGPITLAG